MGLHFIKNGTKHGVCVKRPSLFPASATTYANSQSGLAATRVQGAIDEVVAKVDRGSVSVTADGVKTYGTLLNELQALVDYTKVTDYSYLKIGTVVMHTTVVNTSGSALVGGSVSLNSNPPHLFAHLFILATNDSHYYWADGSTSTTDRTSSTVSNGIVIKLVY